MRLAVFIDTEPSRRASRSFGCTGMGISTIHNYSHIFRMGNRFCAVMRQNIQRNARLNDIRFVVALALRLETYSNVRTMIDPAMAMAAKNAVLSSSNAAGRDRRVLIGWLRRWVHHLVAAIGTARDQFQ
jgi:hypothetical protein